MNTVMGARDSAALFHFVHDACARRLQACGAQLRDAAEYFETE
jgi:hypothetical protein